MSDKISAFLLKSTKYNAFFQDRCFKFDKI